MTKEDLFELMKPLAYSMSNSLASKQHAFNSYVALINECKGYGISNQLITDAINYHLGEEEKISLSYFKNLLVRSKGGKKTVPNKQAKEIKPLEVNKLPKNVSQPEIESDKSDNSIVEKSSIDDYMKVCFGSERIAIRAIEAGVSIDEIKSWNSPNRINLGTKLSNYSQNK